jgi:O-antigen/teichoic acid export membrane protein
VTKPRRSTASLLLTNGAWNALSTAFAGGIAFLVVPLLLRQLGQAAYGIWVLIGSVFAYATILHFGLSSAVNRQIPVAIVQQRDDDVRRVVSTATVFFAGVGVLVALGTLALRYGLARWFNVPVPLIPSAERAVLVVGFLLAATVTAQTFGAALSGYQRYDLSAISRIVMLLVRGGALWLVLARGGGLVAVAWIFGLTELGVNLLQMAFGMRLMPPRLVALRWFDAGLLQEMLAYGGNTFLYSAGAPARALPRAPGASRCG